MRSKFDAFLNLIGLVMVLTVNALANILPINGYNTGQVSGFYPNYFVPAGFTFAIWGIIYLLLIGFVFCSFFSAFGRFDEAGKKAIDSLSPFFSDQLSPQCRLDRCLALFILSQFFADHDLFFGIAGCLVPAHQAV